MVSPEVEEEDKYPLHEIRGSGLGTETDCKRNCKLVTVAICWAIHTLFLPTV